MLHLRSERNKFESLVNSDRSQTLQAICIDGISLRALLIQIGVKRSRTHMNCMRCLRALLIQIGVKLIYLFLRETFCLRALLIQIGVKQPGTAARITACLRALLIQIGVKLHQ